MAMRSVKRRLRTCRSPMAAGCRRGLERDGAQMRKVPAQSDGQARRARAHIEQRRSRPAEAGHEARAGTSASAAPSRPTAGQRALRFDDGLRPCEVQPSQVERVPRGIGAGNPPLCRSGARRAARKVSRSARGRERA